LFGGSEQIHEQARQVFSSNRLQTLLAVQHIHNP